MNTFDEADSGAVSDGETSKRRRRSPEERRSEIVDKAIEFFAEEGFSSSTRGLAKRLGITQPLLYRYFPSKEALISEVYDQVYVNRWQAEWSKLLADRSCPLEDRLNAFYDLYTKTIFDRQWMRIYLFAGLRGVDFNRRYMGTVRKNILEPIIAAARHEFGLPSREASLREIEFVWSAHGGVFYFGIRKLIYDNCGDADMPQMIRDSVAALIFGLGRIFGVTGSDLIKVIASPDASHQQR